MLTYFPWVCLLGEWPPLEPDQHSALAVAHVPVDVHAVLPDPEEGSGGALDLEEGLVAESGADLITLVSPALEAGEPGVGGELAEHQVQGLHHHRRQ